MYRLAVIAEAEVATGFRLAGADVFEATTPAEALEALRRLLAQDYGLVAVNERLLDGTAEERARMMRGRDLPVILPIPAPSAEVESGEEYIGRLVKENLGFYVKLR